MHLYRNFIPYGSGNTGFKVPCPNKSKVDHLQLLRKTLKDHLETKCPNKSYNCEHCGLRYSGILGEHDQICKKKLVSCINTECGLTMERSEMKKHIQTVCKFTVVPCKYNSIGCNVRMRRRPMKQHEVKMTNSISYVTGKDRKFRQQTHHVPGEDRKVRQHSVLHEDR